MGQGEIIERLYYVSKLSSLDLSVILDVERRSINACLKRLRKGKVVDMDKDYNYSLTPKGRDLVKRYYI